MLQVESITTTPIRSHKYRMTGLPSEDNLRLEDIMTWYGQSLVVGSREGVEINDHGQAVFPKEIEHDQGSC